MTSMSDLHPPQGYHPMPAAHVSPDRRHRYERRGPGPALMLLSLNPSTATKHHDDATARPDTPDALTLPNPRAACAAGPKAVAAIQNPIGAHNDAHPDSAAVIVFARGASAGPAQARAGDPVGEVIRLMPRAARSSAPHAPAARNPGHRVNRAAPQDIRHEPHRPSGRQSRTLVDHQPSGP